MKRAIEKKVIFLGPVHPYRGGIASFSQRLALEFLEKGWEVKCITFTFQYPNLLFPGKNQYSEEKQPDLDIEQHIHSLNPLSWNKALRVMREFSPTLVISPHWNPLMSWSSTWILNRLNCQKLVLVHNLYPHETKFYDNFFIKQLMKVNAKYLAISSSVYTDIKMNFPNVNVTKHSHPIYDHYGLVTTKQEAAKSLNLPGDKEYLLFFGLVRAYKGLNILLKALSLIKDELPSLQLIVAGEFYEDQSIYDRIIQKYDLEDRVIIINEFIVDGQVGPYFNIADAVVLPYLHATQSGIGRIATYFVKPLIVTDVGSLAEQAKNGKTGLIAKPNSEDLAATILKFYTLESNYNMAIQEEKDSNTWTGMYNHIVNQCV